MNNKRIIAGIMAFCLMGTVMPSADVIDNAVITAGAVDEAEYTEGTYEQLTYAKYSDHIEITDCDESATEVVIPSEIEGLPVTSIGESAFSECKTLTSIVIPDSVKSIGDCAFLYCENLTDVIIPETLTNIHGCVFDKTLWLENRRAENPLVIVNDVVIDGKTCSGDIIIPDNVKIIADGAFYNCSDVLSVEIPNGITKIGYNTFSNCTSLTSIKIPDSIISIEDSAFCYCIGLTSIEIPNSVERIGKEAFSKCENLMSIEIPDSVASIGASAFLFCKNLKKVTILNAECVIDDYSSTISNEFDDDFNLHYNGTVCGYENSTAQSYAEKYGYKFELIGEAVETSAGDVDGDGMIDANDASIVLAEYAVLATGETGTFTDSMKKSADINEDGQIDSVDSSLILSYYSYTSTGGTDTIEKFLETSDK